MRVKICLILLCVLAVTPQQQPNSVSNSTNPEELTATNEPPQSQQPPQQPHPGDISNVSPLQIQKLLHEQSIRAQLHSNSSLNFADLAKLTPEQQQLFASKLAEQSRIAYQRAQKELKHLQEREHQQMLKLLENAQTSKSQQIKLNETMKVKTMYFKEGYSALLTSTKDYLFDMDPDTQQDFMLSLTVGQDIGFLTTIYSNQNGVYVKPTIVADTQPLILQIYENNTMIMYQSRTFFSDGHVFKGQPNATYTFKFTNRQTHRLISLKISIVVQQAHIGSKATSADVSSHAARTKNVHEGLTNRLMNWDGKATLQASNIRKLTNEIRMYYLYTIGEIVVFLVMGFVQVEMIRKLLGSGSIV